MQLTMPRFTPTRIAILGGILFLGIAFSYGVYKTHYYQSLPKEVIIQAVVKDKLYSPQYKPGPEPELTLITENGVTYTFPKEEPKEQDEQFKLLVMNRGNGKVGTIVVSKQLYAQTEKDSFVDLVFHPDYDLQGMKLATIRKSN